VNKNEIIQKLQSVKPILKEKYGVTDIALFGSYSRGEATSDSDIDLLIHFTKPSADALFESFDLLQNTFKDITVQIVSRKAIKPLYFQAIKKDLIYA